MSEHDVLTKLIYDQNKNARLDDVVKALDAATLAAAILAEFLSQHDERVKAHTWDEAIDAEHKRLFSRVDDDGLIDQHMLIHSAPNPYRKEV